MRCSGTPDRGRSSTSIHLRSGLRPADRRGADRLLRVRWPGHGGTCARTDSDEPAAHRQDGRRRSGTQRAQLHRSHLHRPSDLKRPRVRGLRHNGHRDRRRLHRGPLQLERLHLPRRRPGGRGRARRAHTPQQQRHRTVRQPPGAGHEPRPCRSRDRDPRRRGNATDAALLVTPRLRRAAAAIAAAITRFLARR